MTQGATKDFLASLDGLISQPLPPEVAHATRLRILDTLGCLIAGAHMLRSQNDRTATLAGLCGVDGPVQLVGFDRRCDPMTAALINGMSCHVAELDDGHRFGIVHAGAVLVPALMSVMHRDEMSEDSFLRGVAVGYEAAIAIARNCQPAAKKMGWHGTGVFGAIGAAMGVATALQADRDQLSGALSAAATSASGLLTVIRGQSELKPFNAGQAAHAGLAAAFSGLAGFKGSDDVLGGEAGFFRVMTGDPAVPFQLASDGLRAVQSVYLKPYASCRYAHAPVEAVLSLRDQCALDDVVRIKVETYDLAIQGHGDTDIRGVSAAKMSVPYCVAAALVTGLSGLAAFSEERLRDRDILRAMGLIEFVEDPRMSAKVPHQRPARVSIELRSGETVSAVVELPKGEPETAMSDQDIVDKFSELAEFSGMATGRAQDIAHMILDPKSPSLPAFALI